MKVGELFNHDVETEPCVHCSAPTAGVDDRRVHFEVAENGAKTAWLECYEIVRGRRKYTGTCAEVAA